MKILVGNTGLVGATLKKQITFDLEFNSKNIETFITNVTDNNELYLSCLPATKWLVNQNLANDIDNMFKLISILSSKCYSKIILISTIDIYNDSPLKSNEDYAPNVTKLSYGNNRYFFELLIKQYLKTKELKIFRLPALFSEDIKKNVLYDLLHNNNVGSINANSSFQWYNLNNLVKDINYFSSVNPNQTEFNLFTEPIETIEIIELFPSLKDKVTFSNRIEYDYTTKFGVYIETKDNVLQQIKKLINEIGNKQFSIQ